MPTLTPTYTETPTLTPTLTFTETSTSTPTATSTETPTATATLEATAETTAETHTPTLTPITEATGEVTPETTLEATPESTLDVQPPPATTTPLPTATLQPPPQDGELELIYNNNVNPFESDPTADLYLANWPLLPTGADYSLYVRSSARLTRVTLNTLADVVAQASFYVSSGGAHLTVRHFDLQQKGTSGYTAELLANGQLTLYRSGQVLQTLPLNIAMSDWHTVRISAIGAVVRVAVDGVEYIALEDASPLPEGAVTFYAANLAPRTALLVDNLRVWRPALAAAAPESAGVLSGEASIAGGASLMSGGNNIIGNDEVLVFNFANLAQQMDADTQYTTLPYTYPATLPLQYNPPEVFGFTEGDYAISPNGRQIAGTCGGTICIANVDGSDMFPGQKTITILAPEVNSAPAWSPDGTFLAFQSSRIIDGIPTIGIWISQPNGYGELQLTDFGEDPVWFGDTIYFTEPGVGMFEVLADGSAPATQITSGVYDGAPDIASVGTQVLLAYETAILHGGAAVQIGVQTRDVLTGLSGASYFNTVAPVPGACENAAVVTTETIDLRQPTWSPDGSQLAVLASAWGSIGGATPGDPVICDERLEQIRFYQEGSSTFSTLTPAQYDFYTDTLDWALKPQPLADFIYTSGAEPYTVSFTSTSSFILPTSVCSWDFEDDGVYDVTGACDQPVTQVYPGTGSYSAKLKVATGGREDVLTKMVQVQQPVLATNTPQPTTMPACPVTVAGGNVSFRHQTNTTEDNRLMIIGDDGDPNNLGSVVTTLYDAEGRWNDATAQGADPADWLVGTNVQLIATFWIQVDTITWLKLRATNVNGQQVEGYMALRPPESPSDLLTLGCQENTLPGFPQPTPTPGPTSTPDGRTWYVICSLRPNELPPIEVRVRSNPELVDNILFTFNGGEAVRRVSLDPAQEVVIGEIIFVEIEWTGTPSSTAWVARQDTLGALLTSTREASCPLPTPTPTPTIMPTPSPTPDPAIPRHSPGRFNVPPPDGGFGSAFANERPANVGAYGCHPPNCTIDIMPESLEQCIDTSTAAQSPNCDPPNSPMGIPVYAPVSGTVYILEDRISMILYLDNAILRNDVDPNYSVRREIHLTHLQPTVSNWQRVQRGTLIGYLCRFDNRLNCGINNLVSQRDGSFTINHLAFQVRFYSNDAPNGPDRYGLSYAPLPEETLGILAIPNCLVNVWIEDRVLPRLNPDPTYMQACP